MSATTGTELAEASSWSGHGVAASRRAVVGDDEARPPPLLAAAEGWLATTEVASWRCPGLGWQIVEDHLLPQVAAGRCTPASRVVAELPRARRWASNRPQAGCAAGTISAPITFPARSAASGCWSRCAQRSADIGVPHELDRGAVPAARNQACMRRWLATIYYVGKRAPRPDETFEGDGDLTGGMALSGTGFAQPFLQDDHADLVCQGPGRSGTSPRLQLWSAVESGHHKSRKCAGQRRTEMIRDLRVRTSRLRRYVEVVYIDDTDTREPPSSAAIRRCRPRRRRYGRRRIIDDLMHAVRAHVAAEQQAAHLTSRIFDPSDAVCTPHPASLKSLTVY